MTQRKIIVPGIILTTIVSAFINEPLFTKGVYAYSWGYYIKLGYLSLFAVFLFICFIPAFIKNLYVRYQSANDTQKPWRLYALVTGGLAFFGITDFLPAYGVSLPFPPLGYIVVGIFATLMSYFILRYQLTDMKLIFGRTMGYIILTLILLLLYTSFFLVFSPSTWNTHILVLNAIFFIISLYVFSLCKDKTQHIVDEIFFKEKINFSELIVQFNSNLRDLRNPASLLIALFNFFENDLRIEASAVFILRKNEMRWRLYEQKRTANQPLYKEIDDFQSIDQYFVKNTNIIATDYFINRSAHMDEPIQQIIDLARQYNGALIMPLVHHAEFLGFILLGKKMSRETYFTRDVKALANLTVPFIIAWENANHYELLQQSNLLKSDFISIASHQLRTPITNLNWVLEMIVSEKKGALNEWQKKLLQDALGRMVLIKQLVDQLLRIVNFENGELKMHIVPHNLSILIQEMLKNIQPTLIKKNITLIYKLDDALPFVLTDQNCTKIIFNVLFENAIQYTPPQGTITIATHVLTQKGEKKMLITVQDTGIGIPENQRMDVFTQFFRAQNAFSLFPNGTGVDLFYTKKLIEALDGSIWFRSAEGKGATFYFTLPVVDKLL